MPNFFKPSMVDSKDYMEGLGIENPEAGKIDNSPGFMQKALQTLVSIGLFSLRHNLKVDEFLPKLLLLK